MLTYDYFITRSDGTVTPILKDQLRNEITSNSLDVNSATGEVDIAINRVPQLQVTSAGTNSVNGINCQGQFSATYTDGLILDYVAGTGRLLVGGTDAISFFSGGLVTPIQIGQLNTTGLTIGTGVTGTIIQSLVGGGAAAIYNASLTPSASNFAIQYWNNGTNLNATTNIYLSIAGNSVEHITATGSQITGTLSTTATGTFTGIGNLGKVIVNNNAAATYTFGANQSYVGFTGTQVASLAFTFPAASASIDGLICIVYTQAAVGTSSTWSSVGATFVGAPATLVANSVTRFIYDNASLQWLPT